MREENPPGILQVVKDRISRKRPPACFSKLVQFRVARLQAFEDPGSSFDARGAIQLVRCLKFAFLAGACGGFQGLGPANQIRKLPRTFLLWKSRRVGNARIIVEPTLLILQTSIEP